MKLSFFKRFGAAAVVLVGLSSAPAHAASYGFDFLLNGALEQGGSSQLHIEGFAPTTPVIVSLICPDFERVLEQPSSDVEGVIDLLITVPADAPSAQCAVTVVGAAEGGGTKSLSLSLAVGLGSDGNGLPTTGSSPTSMLSLSIGAALLGVTILAASRLRPRAAVETAA